MTSEHGEEHTMKQLSQILPCYAADTSGVCSALYELGGMTVVHDASGCNSTYATHDEPRWYDKHAMIYISALTETDAVMGDDEKLISDVCTAAADQHPRFIALCGSPMPMMIGTDFDAAAEEIERRSGIRTLALHTNGTRSYLAGASEAFLSVTRAFVAPAQKQKNCVNILGATPLDLELHDTVPAIRQWLTKNGFTPGACLAMNDTLDNIAQTAAAAEASLVLSYSGLAAAAYLQREYGIPFVCGIPLGTEFPKQLASALHTAIATGEPQYPCTARHKDSGTITVIGESIAAGSIAAELGAHVICPLDTAPELCAESDSTAYKETDIAADLRRCMPQSVVADPLYQYILPHGTALVRVPHFAFSGRCFQHEMKSIICQNIPLSRELRREL